MTIKTSIPSILIVDDRRDILQSIEMCLGMFGFNTVLASSGAEALSLVNEQRFNLILLDIDMPVMDGFEVCRRLKDDKRSADIPVVFVSGRADFDDREQAMNCGGIDFLAKPFDLNSLKQCVLRALSEDGRLNPSLI